MTDDQAGGRPWTPDEVRRLRRLAREGTAEAAADALGRTLSAVRMKATKSGISFRKVVRAGAPAAT